LIISNIDELKSYYNKYDTSVYMVEPEQKTIFFNSYNALPEYIEFTQTSNQIQEQQPATEEDIENTVYIGEKSMSQELFVNTDFEIVDNSFVIQDNSFIGLSDDYVDFLIINTIDGEILIQPSSVEISIANKTATVHIIKTLPIENINILSIKIMKGEYVFPESVTSNLLVTFSQSYTHLYRISNICYNYYIIMNSYGIPLDRTQMYTKDVSNFHIVSDSRGIMSYTQRQQWTEIPTDTRIAPTLNPIKSTISESDPPHLIISKNGQLPSVAKNLTKNRYTYIAYPFIPNVAIGRMYQYSIRDDYYSSVEKLILKEEYNITEDVSDIQVSDEYDKQDKRSKLGFKNKEIVSKKHQVQLDLHSDFYEINDLPKKIFIVDEKYFPYE
jgi:hypothetical protein